MKKDFKKFSRGFTLLELLVVIIIIGLIATIVIASVNSARAKGRDTKRITELDSMRDALSIYYSTNGSYPQTADILVTQKLLPVLPTGVHYTGLDTDTSAPCKGYQLGVTLETNHKVLSTDKDFDSRPTGNWVSTPYSTRCGNGTSFAIRGTNVGSETTCKNGDQGSYCYDIYQ